MAGTIRDEYSKDRLIGYVRVGFGKLLRRSKASTEARKSTTCKAAPLEGLTERQGCLLRQ
jgi:hypothetical protein